MGLLLWLLAGCLTSPEDYLAMREALMDQDGDGYRAPAYGGLDCADDDPMIFPGADEDCSAIDRDCDGRVDEGAIDARAWYADGDGDGYGGSGGALSACTRPAGTVAVAGDCNDGERAVFPGAEERCDGRDGDCDGAVDEGYDRDGDGWSACATGGAGTADCDDREPSVHPGAPEICDDGVDNNCDGTHACALTGELALWLADRWIPGQGGEGLGMVLAVGSPGGPAGPILAAGTSAGSEVALITDPLGEARQTRIAGAASLGRSLAVADLDGDGSDEVIAGALGAVWVFPTALVGGSGGSGADAEVDTLGAALLGESSFGLALAALPAVPGERPGALLIGEPYGRSGGGAAWLLPADATSVDGAEAVIYGAAEDAVGEGVASGDTDGDGLPEVLVAAAGGVGLFSGPAEGWLAWSDADAVLAGAAPLVLAGDVDGDGLMDVLVGGDQARLYTGGARSELAVVEGVIGSLAGGDADGDGRADVLIGDVSDSVLSAGGAGSVGVFYAPVSGALDTGQADLTLLGTAPGELAGRAFAADLDGDAHAEILTGAPGAGGGDGGIYLLLGRGL